MNRLVLALLALALLLSPIFAALPDDTTLPQTVWASLLCALVMVGALAAVAQARNNARPRQTRRGEKEGRGDLAPTKRHIVGAGSPRPSFSAATASAVSSPAATAFAVLLALALLSLVARLLTQHSIAYLGLMLRGWAVLATEFALFALCRSLSRASRGAFYLLLGAAVVGSTAISSIGVNEYLLHFVAHQASWRVFATSTPDFLAGYLVLLLPVTLALFLGAPAEKRLPLLLGLIIVLQMATLLTTGSRFALVSLLVAFAVFAGALTFAVRRGLPLDAALRRRILGIVIVVALAGLGAARPILNRLHSTSEGNSGAFRIWTWRGAAHMAAANPILGAGIGTWIDTYPRYALTGFTRLAHNSYLQLADECGLPALLVLAATLGFVGVAGTRGLKTAMGTVPSPADEPRPQRATLERTGPPGRKIPPPAARRADSFQPRSFRTGPLSLIAPADDRLLLCGLLGSLAAGVIQNLIDSDWYVFFIGVAFWALAGLTVGLTERAVSEEAVSASGRASRRRLIPLGAVAALLLLLFISEGVGAWFGYQAQIAADPGIARSDYETAQTWDPLNARYPAEQGARVEARVGSLIKAGFLLQTATQLEPSGTNFHRLGVVLDSGGSPAEAATAYKAGLRVDPNSLDLLLALAKDSPPEQALGLYRRIAALEDSPVGRVRAIGEITEARFALADAALGIAAAAAGDAQQAVYYDERAQRLLEAYINEGGTLNPERQAQIGNSPDPVEDTQFRDLYAQVMTALAAATPADRKTALQTRARIFQQQFQAVIDAGMGDTASSPAEAAADYQRAAGVLEGYVTDAQGAPADLQGSAEMRGLYQRVMDSLTALTPADQQAAVQSREQAGLQKFAVLFSKG